MMYSNAIHPAGGAVFGGNGLGYAAALDGLRGFDTVTAALRARQDVIQRSAASAAAAYAGPGCPHAPGAGAALAGAVAAFAGSEAGRAKIESFASSAAAWLGRVFGSGGPEQLRLPLEG